MYISSGDIFWYEKTHYYNAYLIPKPNPNPNFTPNPYPEPKTKSNPNSLLLRGIITKALCH